MQQTCNKEHSSGTAHSTPFCHLTSPASSRYFMSSLSLALPARGTHCISETLSAVGSYSEHTQVFLTHNNGMCARSHTLHAVLPSQRHVCVLSHTACCCATALACDCFLMSLMLLSRDYRAPPVGLQRHSRNRHPPVSGHGAAA